MGSKSRLSIQAILLPLLIFLAFSNVDATKSLQHSKNIQGRSPPHPKLFEGANKKEEGHHQESEGSNHHYDHNKKEETKNKWHIPKEDKEHIMKFDNDGVTVEKKKKNFEIIRAEQPFSLVEPEEAEPEAAINKLQYYEVTLQGKRESDKDITTISIGLADSDCRDAPGISRQEVWEKEFKYSSAYGHFITGISHFPYGPPFDNGDTVGCGVILRDGNVYAFFTLNGNLVGDGPIRIPSSLNLHALYPTISFLKAKGYKITANFEADAAKFEAELDEKIKAQKIHII